MAETRSLGSGLTAQAEAGLVHESSTGKAERTGGEQQCRNRSPAFKRLLLFLLLLSTLTLRGCGLS
jgi:hypothetical protein